MDPVPLYFGVISAASAVNNTKVTALIFAIVILLLFSALFSAMETSFTSANRIRLKSLENNGSKRAKRVLKQLENYTKLLNTVLIGNNIVNITTSTLATLLFAELIQQQAIAALVSTVVITFLVLLFGEIVPKSIAKENAEGFAMFACPILAFISVILTPFIWLFSLWRKIYKPKRSVGVTDDELITIIEEAESGGGLNSHESQLIRSAIEFDDVELYDIIIPRVNIVAVHDTDSWRSVADVFAETGFSRLPVYHDSIDMILGILHEKDFYAFLRENMGALAGSDRPSGTDADNDKELSNSFMSKVKPSICLSRNMKISDALRTLQKAKVHMAVVVDEFGGTTGLVTLEDILEELVGEIYDEHDEEEVLFRAIGENEFIVSGSENLEDMFEQLGMDLKEEYDSTTVGGWVTEELKRIPLPDESFQFQNLQITVTKASMRKVIEIKVLRHEPDQNEDEEE